MKNALAVLMFVLLVPAAAYAATATLAWDANTETDLAGYRAHYGISPGNYTNHVEAGAQTQIVLTLAGGQTYYFAATAYDTSGNESGFSNEVNLAVPPDPVAQCVDGMDNDADGLTDYPADPGCSSASDNDETNVPLPAEVTVTFDNPSPNGSSGSYLNGIFGGINWGTNKWRWEGPYLVDPSNHVYFASNSGNSRTFTFSPGPKLLKTMRVFTGVNGTLTLSDNLGQTKVQSITTGAMRLVTTNWINTSTTVTVKFTAGWELGVDDIVYTP